LIRVVRVPEPSNLAAARAVGLVAAASAIAKGAKIKFVDYDVVKADLAKMQHNKCCYCEKREEQAKYRDVDHFRPKSPYWWLAWSWDNLLFACIDCNREFKRDLFPHDSGSTPLRTHQPPPGQEVPLLIDPVTAVGAPDPTAEIVFRRERVSGVERWVPRGTTLRGRQTIEVCGLDRPSLLDLYATHVIDFVRPRLKGLFEAVTAQNPRAVVVEWSSATRALFAPTQPFRALSYDAVEVLVPGKVRADYSLSLVRPT
jgi:uncharacterized protein (TIGR02646 family)